MCVSATDEHYTTEAWEMVDDGGKAHANSFKEVQLCKTSSLWADVVGSSVKL